MKYPKANSWTLKKLRFLRQYLPAFVKATKKAWQRYYVDGFAGPGYNQAEHENLVEGSPLLALKHSEFTKYFLVERSLDHYQSLQEQVSGIESAQGKVNLYRGDFNHLIDIILKQIDHQAPTLFFLDPFGLELKWSTLKKIANRGKADIFILISSSGVVRARKDYPDTVTEFFGDDSWRHIRSEVGQTWFKAFTEAYRDRMRQLGLEGSELVTVATNKKNTPLHVLAFHSKNLVALKIANAVFHSVESNPTQPGLFLE